MKGSKRRGKRPGTWELRVEGGCDPLSGKRVQRSLTFEGSAREADSRLAELSVEMSRQPIIGGSRTMTELIRAGLEQAEAEGLEATTLRGYRRCATRYILPAFGKRRIGKITTEEIDRFYRALAKEGYAHSTVKQTHVVLCRVFDTAIRWRWMGHNPARSARPPRIAKIDPKPVPVDMIGELLAEARKTYPELATCIVLAADTGMRRGELCALRWSRVDLSAGTVRIDRAIGGASFAYEKDTKNHQHRTIALSGPAIDELRRHRARMAERALRCGVSLRDDAFVFSGEPDGSSYWWPSNLDHSFRRVRKRANLPDWVKLHGLRHTQVTQLLDAGVPVRAVSGRVGHLNSSTTTNIYSHWVSETDERAAEVIAERIWGAKREGSNRA